MCLTSISKVASFVEKMQGRESQFSKPNTANTNQKKIFQIMPAYLSKNKVTYTLLL